MSPTEPFLIPSEITNLTDRQQRPAQVKVLKGMQIEHKVRPDGSIAILRAHITKVFGGDPAASKRQGKQAPEADWAAI